MSEPPGFRKGSIQRVAAGRASRRAVLASGAAAALALAGCADGGAPGPMVSDYRGTPPAGTPAWGEPDRWHGRTLTVGAWGGEVQQALVEAVWEPFAAATGGAVNPIPAAPERLATPTGDGAPDLVLLDPVRAAALASAGALTPVPQEAVPEEAIGRLDEAGHAAPAYAYALVNARRRDALPEERVPRSWAAWWDTSAIQAPRTMGRNPLGTLEAALLADGASPADLYPLDVERALRSLERVAEAVGDRWWTRGIEPVGWLGTERADLASAWHYRVIAGQWDGLAVDLVWEQALLVVDQWVIPVGAREPGMAADAIAFALRPEAQAALARAARLGPVVAEAFVWVEPWLRPQLPTSAEAAEWTIPIDPWWWSANGDAARAACNRWFAARGA